MDEKAPYRIEPFLSEDGTENLAINGYPVHSRKSAGKDAERFAASLPLENDRLTIVLGVGPGTIIKPILHRQKTEPAPILLYEPITTVKQYLQEHTKWAEPDSILTMDQETLRQRVMELLRENPSIEGRVQVVLLPSYRRILPDGSLAGSALQEMLQKQSGFPNTGHTTSTIARFARLWHRNHIRHLVGPRNHTTSSLRYPAKNCPINRDTDNGEIPAILFCGAGPSLLKDLEPILLDKDQGLQRSSFFIMAADTALAPLLCAGITPDLVISIDAGYGTLFHLLAAFSCGLSIPSPVPVLTWSGGSNLLERFFQNLYHYRSSLPLDQLQFQLLSESSILPWPNEPGNAMGPALHMTNALGNDTLYTAGASLRLQHTGIAHERGTGHMLYHLHRSNRIRPITQPGKTGYDKNLTAKNSRAHRAITLMQDQLGVKLVSLSDANEGNEPQIWPESSREERSRYLQQCFCRFIRREELVGQLRAIDPASTGLSEASGVSIGSFQRWWRML